MPVRYVHGVLEPVKPVLSAMFHEGLLENTELRC